MPLLTLEKACLAFGHHALLDHVEFQLDAGERVGLIGRNGGGKSSMLRALAGEIRLDDGKVWRPPGLRLAYVPQEPLLSSDNTVFQEVSNGLGEISRVLLDYHEVSHALGHPDESGGEDMDALLERLQDLQTKLEAQDGWNIQARVE
ncbi:MAG: ATP-binding cassette domain-containing protein, partial [Candidatus Nitrotoga sp.]